MRFTEAVHPETLHLDSLAPKDIVSKLQAAELEIFGNAWGLGLLDPRFMADLKAFAKTVHRTVQHPQGKVIFAGAGTSGRLALQAQLTFPRRPNQGRVYGCLAGGPSAFFKAKEGVEDSPQVGMRDLKTCAEGPGPRVFLGITCGLSAAYVAGALAQAMAQDFDAVAILGFNALEDANTRPLPGLDRHFRELLQEMSAHPQGFLLNPILGPEPLTGSTRLKGGTATKVVLDILLSGSPIEAGLQFTQQILSASDGLATGLDQHMTRAGQELLLGHGITYLSHGRAGLMALLDASECPPTFGAHPEEVKAYLGPATIDLFSELQLRDLSWRQMSAEEGAVFWLQEVSDDPPDDFQHVARQHQARAITHPPAAKMLLNQASTLLKPRLEDLLFKRQLNVLSTGAFVLAGKVWGNRMIDLRISNHKLLDRASRIVAEISQTPLIQSRQTITRVILGEAMAELPSAQLIAKASSLPKVVPLALILLATDLNLEQAQDLLATYPKVREGLGSLLEKS